MHIGSVLLVALISARINAVPLNINLGAYSPALVVGDGEISFKGKEEVSELMDALEGAAVSGAAKNGASNFDGTTTADNTTPDGLGVPEKAPTSNFPPQGLGKIIAPRFEPLSKRDEKKRDINGFNAALNFASEAMGRGPLIELSTGPTGSGVGVKVQPKRVDSKQAELEAVGVPVTAPAPAGAKNGLGRRDDSQSPKTKTTVTTMFVRGGPRPDSVEGSETKDLEKRSTPNEGGEENLNLKVADGELAELTFVETRSIDDTTINEE